MRHPIRTIIADDEALARDGLVACLKQEPDIRVVAECEDGLEALEAIRDHAPDLAILDIQMPGMTGLDLVRELGPGDAPVVIFLSAYEEHALAAFDASAVDYVLKPYQDERIALALQRARGRIRRSDEKLLSLIHRLGGAPEPEYIRRIAVRKKGHIALVEIGDVVWIEASGNYAVLHTESGTHRVRTTLATLEEQLDPDEFVRVHRGAIVQIQRIRRIEPSSRDHVLILDTEERVPIGRAFRKGVKALNGLA